MNRSSAELKGHARDALKGKTGITAGGFALLSVIILICNLATMFLFSSPNLLSVILDYSVTFILSLLTTVLSTGYTYLILNICRKKEFSLSNLFHCFKNNPDKIIIIAFILSIINTICLLPFRILTTLQLLFPQALNIYTLFILIVLGLIGCIIAIYISLNFAFSYIIILDVPETNSLQALKESRLLMKGNKGSLFYLQMSFLGLILLSFLSCFIALIWVAPYMEATRTCFYLDRTGELDSILSPSQTSPDSL